MPRTKVRWYSVFASYVSHVVRTYMPTFPRCPRSCCVIMFARFFSAASTLSHFFISISININIRISISSLLSLSPSLYLPRLLEPLVAATVLAYLLPDQSK